MNSEIGRRLSETKTQMGKCFGDYPSVLKAIKRENCSTWANSVQ